MAIEKLTQAKAVNWIVNDCGLDPRDVRSVLESVQHLLSRQLGKTGPGEQIIPFLGLKAVLKTTPKRPRREVRNPATGEMQWAAAKPAGKKIVIRVLKSLKDAVL